MLEFDGLQNSHSTERPTPKPCCWNTALILQANVNRLDPGAISPRMSQLIGGDSITVLIIA